MNLKKIFTIATALILGSCTVFAQDIDEKTIEYTQKAVSQSLAIYQAHKDLNQLTDQDRAIDTALNVTLPGIFNQVENPSDGLDTELENAVTALANVLMTYQTLYPSNMLDMDYAKLAVITIALTHAAQNKLISEEVAQILIATLLESMLPEEDPAQK